MVFWRKRNVDMEDDYSDVEYIITDGEDVKEYEKKKHLFVDDADPYVLFHLPRDVEKYLVTEDEKMFLKEIDNLIGINEAIPYGLDSFFLIAFATNTDLYDRLFDIPCVRVLIKNSDYYGLDIDNIAQKLFYISYNGTEYEVQYLKEFLEYNDVRVSEREYRTILNQYDSFGYTQKEFMNLYNEYLRWW